MKNSKQNLLLSTYIKFILTYCYSTDLTAFLSLLRKDLGRSKPAIFLP